MAEVQHESLALAGYWRLAWFGKLTENPLTAGPDLRIRVYLAPLEDPTQVPPEAGKIKGPLKPMLLPVGELPRLHLNAILHNGRLISHLIHRLNREELIQRELDCSRPNITIFERSFRDEQGEPVVPVYGKWTDLPEDPERNGLFVAIGSPADRYATVIPAIEIFRFFYATSDVLAKALLRDHFLDPNTHLWNIDKTAMAPDGRALIWLRKRMLDADARFLARFAFDNYALHQAQQIFLYASALNHPGGERMIRALPPFQDTVDTRFLGIRIGGPDDKRVLVTRLIQCYWKPPFTHLKWDRDNDGRFDPDRRDERDPADWSPNLLTVPDSANPAPTTLADQPPSVACVPSRLREPEIAERFPELAKTPAEKMPQDDTKARAEHRDWKPVMAEAYTGSVVDGQSSQDLVGSTIIEGLEQKPKAEREFTDAVDAAIGQGDYLTVMGLLLAIRDHSLAVVEIMTVLDAAATAHGVDFNVFPEEMDGKKKAWLYVDDKKDHRRMALLAQVTHEGRRRYVIELQQRRVGECSTLVAWQHEGRSLAPGLLAHLIMDCARAEGATLDSAALVRVNWARLRHTTKGTDEESASHFLNRIFHAVPIGARPCDRSSTTAPLGCGRTCSCACPATTSSGTCAND